MVKPEASGSIQALTLLLLIIHERITRLLLVAAVAATKASTDSTRFASTTTSCVEIPDHRGVLLHLVKTVVLAKKTLAGRQMKTGGYAVVPCAERAK